MVDKSRLKEGSEDEYEKYSELETLNSMVPLWKRNKSELTDDDYNSFYKEKFFDFTDPAKVIHTNVEGVVSYTSLLFIPSKAPYNYYSKDYEKGLQLYSSGVLIMEKCADLLPDYFSFVKGLVDSQDLSLNISREMLQHDRQLKDKLKDLVMFYSSKEKALVTLSEYVSRMKPDDKFIYYACGESIDKIDKLPQTELLKDKGYEILYMTDDIDEFAVQILHEFDGKEFKSVSAEDLEIEETAEEKEKAEKQAEESKDMLEAMKDALDGKVAEVRLSQRLKSHPVCLTTKGGLSIEMEKVLNAMPMDQKVKSERVLEINAGHPVLETLKKSYEADKDSIKMYAELLYNQALLIEGLPVDDPVAFSNSICELMTK